jgi:hypothetical protein
VQRNLFDGKILAAAQYGLHCSAQKIATSWACGVLDIV